MNMAVDLSWWFQERCSSLFVHEQSVPTCINKPVNNHIHAGQLNHAQALLYNFKNALV